MKKNLSVIVGLVLSILGFKLALLPYNVNVGGFSGLSQLVNYLIGIPFSVSSILFNGYFFFWAYRKHGWKNVVRAIITTAIFNLSLDFLPQIEIHTVSYHTETFIICMAAIVSGMGFGFIIRGESSTGGSDYLSEIITLKFNSISRGTASTFINIVIVCSTAALFGIDNFLRAIIATVLVNESVNITLYVRSDHELPKSLRFCKHCWMLLKKSFSNPLPQPAASSVDQSSFIPSKDEIITMRSGNRIITLRVIDVTTA